jgi:hypothetical protein
MKAISDAYLLKPNVLMLAWTKEYVNLVSHNRVAARVAKVLSRGSVWAFMELRQLSMTVLTVTSAWR